MDFLPLLDECIKLSDAFQRQVVHQVDLVRVRDELVLESLNRHRKCCREEAYLTSGCREVDQLLEEGLEFRRQKLVGLQHNNFQSMQTPENKLAKKLKRTSSMITVLHCVRLATPLLARSRMRPGVPTKMCTVL